MPETEADVDVSIVPVAKEKDIIAAYAGYVGEEDTHDTQPISAPMLRWQHMGASSLDRQGGKFYNSLEGSDKPYDSIDVVFINGRNSRAFYAEAYDPKRVKAEGAPRPDCKSNDGIHGEGLYGPGSPENKSGSCETCPMAQWSGRGQGATPPRCSLSYDRLIYDFQTGQLGVMSFARTKIKAIAEFQRAIQARNRGTVPMWGYKCRISSEARENFFVPKIEILGVIPPDEALRFHALKQESDAAFMRATGISTEVESTDEEPAETTDTVPASERAAAY